MSTSKGERIISQATIEQLSTDVEIPPMGLIEQLWERNPLTGEDIGAATETAVSAMDLENLPLGSEIAVGVGSRGISNLRHIVTGVVRSLQDRGYEPFVFPAMGSHGGATSSGQVRVLDDYGIAEANVGCPIRATMETERIGTGRTFDVPVYADANACSADAIMVINRVKPHTSFTGRVESGLSKMLVIGMGKQRGAKMAHEFALDWSFRKMIPEIASVIIEELPVIGGVAIVEDQEDETESIEGVPASAFLDREAELLQRAYENLPRLPFSDLDVVIFDRMGKDISGAGMDTNVTGRIYAFNEPSPESPNIRRIYTRSLTPASHGNATGIGQAEFIHQQLFKQVDVTDTVINAVTAGSVENARIPTVVETDYAGLAACISTVGVRSLDELKIIRATDTAHLRRFYASPALVEKASDRADLRVLQNPEPIEWNHGDFVAPSPTSLHEG